MLYITGDIHGQMDIGKIRDHFPQEKNLTKDDYMLVCGDIGVVWGFTDERDKAWQEWYEERSYTTLFVDGNHENHDLLDGYPVEEWHGGKVHKITPTLIHLMRGQVYEIEGKTFFTMGGASSTDKFLRKEGISWWERELPNQEEYEEAIRNLEAHNNTVDVVITHCAPTHIMRELFHTTSIEGNELNHFLDKIDQEVNYTYWFFGHYHKDIWVKENMRLIYNDILQFEEGKPVLYVEKNETNEESVE